MRILFILLPLLLTSCSWFSANMPKLSLTPHKLDVSQGNLVTSEMRAKLKLGMSRAQVKDVLGTPLISDPFHANRWDYIYRFTREGKLVEQQRLTVFFEADKLARIDDSDMPDPATASPGKVELGR